MRSKILMTVALLAESVHNRAGTGFLTNVRAITAGALHTCALLTNGQVRCWGLNGNGQLGDGTVIGSSRPVTVLNPAGSGPLVNVTQVAAGSASTCAVVQSGQVRCWGANDHGQLGIGTTDQRLRAAVVRPVTGTGALTTVSQVEVGRYSTCARLSTGQARCWGSNTRGQLGDGTTEQRTRPVVVKNIAGGGPLTGVRRISTGGAHTCAVLGNATARCWGRTTTGSSVTAPTSTRPGPWSWPTPSGPVPSRASASSTRARAIPVPA